MGDVARRGVRGPRFDRTYWRCRRATCGVDRCGACATLRSDAGEHRAGDGLQVAFEMLGREAKVDMTFIPFSGYTLAIQVLLGKQVTAALADLSTLQGQLQTGKLRALATTARARFDTLPNVPTAIESGYKSVEAEFFGAVIAPAKTPKQTMEQLIGRFKTAIADSKIGEVRPARLVSRRLVRRGVCRRSARGLRRLRPHRWGIEYQV